MPTRRTFLESTAVGLLGATLAGPRAGAAETSPWSVVESSKAGARLRMSAAPGRPNEGPTLHCDPARRHQRIVGFGGALTESSAYVLAKLPAAERERVLRSYFDPREGIGYTLARTHIGSCDFSLSTWSLAPTPGDYELLDFSLAPMRRWLMPLLHDAQRIAGADRFKLVASPWSPPAWMKTNHQMDGGGNLRAEYAPAWARHYTRFIAALRNEEHIGVWGLTVQNEPEAAQRWESCLYTPEQERDFVRDHLGPTLAREGFGEVRLFGFDHNRDALERRADAMLGDADSARYLAGLAMHWYVSEDYAAASRVLAKYPGKQILFTEGCVEGGSRPGDWSVAERYAKNLIGDLGNGVCGWIDWNIALDMRGGPNHVGNFCDAPVLVDTDSGVATYQPSFHAVAHFARYVQPGAHRVQLDGGSEALQALAFENPDASVAIVAFNSGAAPLRFNLALGDRRHGCNIPGRAIQTYVARA